MFRLSAEQVRRGRLEGNGLVSTGIGGGVLGVVRRLVGVQGQERGAAELAWQPRSRGLARGDVVQALDVGRSVVRTWAMRGTIHLLAAEDVGWLLALLGPRFVAKGRRRREQLGLDEAVCARATAVMREALQGSRGLTRGELAQRLEAEDISVAGQAIYHLVYRAGLDGVVCFGATRDGEETFVLLEDWLGTAVALPAAAVGLPAVGRLARRYLRGYGPASARDFGRWSGLGLREARAGLDSAKELLEAAVAGWEERLFMLPEQAEAREEVRPAPEARLLPAYDSFLLGYAGREWIVLEAYAREVHPGGGVIRPTLLIDGVAAGTWRLREGDVEVAPFAAPEGAAERAVAREVADMRRFLGVDSF